MKDCQSEEKFCYVNSRRSYRKRNSKIIFPYFFFLKNEEIGINEENDI